MFLSSTRPRSVKSAAIRPSTCRQTSDLPPDIVGHDDPARIGQGLQAGGDVDDIAEEIAVVVDDVADLDTGAEQHAPRRRLVGAAPVHPALDLDGAGHRRDAAGELDQEPVARGLDQATAMRRDARVDQLAAVALQVGQRAGLVLAHQPAVAGGVQGEDGDEPAGQRETSGRPLA